MIPIISKKIIAPMLVFTLALVLASQIKAPFSEAAVACGDVTPAFTDAAFLNCVATALGTNLPTPTVEACAADAMGSLTCFNKGISNIAGAEYLTGLTSLRLHVNDITDISPISGLIGLKTLWLNSNEITDISDLSGMTALQDLNINLNNNISNISVLSGMTGLWKLAISGNYVITDISVLSGMTGLREFYSSSNDITNIGVLSGLTALQVLKLGYNEIADISALSGLNALRELDLCGNHITDPDMSDLSGLTALQELGLCGNVITDISVVSGLTVLRELNLWNADVTNIGPLNGLTTLQELILSHNNIIDLSPLAGLINLTETRLDDNNISDLSPLNNGTNGPGSTCDAATQDCSCTDCFADNNNVYNGIDITDNAGLNGAGAVAALAQVAILRDTPTAVVTHDIVGGCPIYVTADFTDANFLTCVATALGTNLPTPTVEACAAAALTTLNCDSQSISSINGAEHLTGLSSTGLSNNNISDLSPLSGLTALTELNLNFNSITDISALNGLTNMEVLRLSLNSITDITPLNGLTNLTRTSLGNNNVSDLSPLNDGTNGAGSGCAPGGGACACTSCFADGNEIDISDNSGLNGVNATAALNQVAILEDSAGPSHPNDVTHNIVGGCTPTYITADFEDAHFLACVSNSVGTPILDCAANALTGLGCHSQNISSIAGAQHLTGLTSFYAYFNDISDLSPLSGLTNLTFISLMGNNISDISPLSSLTNLTHLHLQGNDVADISPLTNLMNLQRLEISNNGISDISVLANKVDLTFLNLNNNNLTDISDISGLTGLTTLELRRNDITDISPLSSITGLTNLELSENYITDPSPVSGLTNLIDLNLYSNNISDLSSLTTPENPDMAAFASSNTINLEDNPLCDPADPDIALLRAKGATVKRDPLVCGDGFLAGKCTEQCDDGNFVIGDGCDANCQGEYYGCYLSFETPPQTIGHSQCNNSCINFRYLGGWSPDSESCICYISDSPTCDAICTAVDAAYPTDEITCGFINCGNGSVEPDGVWPTREECDDGNLEDGDGCSASCTIGQVISGGRSRNQEEDTSEHFAACYPMPVEFDISYTSIGQLDGEPTVILEWRERGVEPGVIYAEDKIGILFTYFEINPTIGDNEIRLENIFTRHIYDEISNNPILKQAFDEQLTGDAGSDVCDDPTADELSEVIYDMRDDPYISSWILKFVNDLLLLENTLVRTGKTADTPFTDYYYDELSGGASTGTLTITRTSKTGGAKNFDINPNSKSWTDTYVPVGEYKYQLTNENCDEPPVEGYPYPKAPDNWFVIAPAIDPGKPVDVTLDLQIKVKESYGYLLMDRFRKLFIPEDIQIPSYTRSCEEIRDKLFAKPNSELALEYVITCFAEGDDALIKEIVIREKEITPPLVAMLRGLNGDATHEIVEGCIGGKIAEIDESLIYRGIIKSSIKDNVSDFLYTANIGNLIGEYKTIMNDIDTNYFAGVSNSANVEIEKCPGSCNPGDDNPTYTVHTDIFGKGTLNIGVLTSGNDYELRIRLKGEDYVLPKIKNLQINNANKIENPQPFESEYVANIDLVFDKSFRYGNFDNTDDEISMDDFSALANLLSGEDEGDICNLWDLWKFANVDGIDGIDIRDFVILLENWGGLKESIIEESEINLLELLELFGIIVKTTPELEVVVKVANWLDMVGSDC